MSSYQQNAESIHICARLQVESMHLRDSGIGWAADTMEKANEKIARLEKVGMELFNQESDRIEKILRERNPELPLRDFNMFEFAERLEYMQGKLSELEQSDA